MSLQLFVDVVNKKLVRSRTSTLDAYLPPFFFGSDLAVEVYGLTPNPNDPLTPYTDFDLSSFTVTVQIGNPTTLSSYVPAALGHLDEPTEHHNGKQGWFNLNTKGISDLLDGAQSKRSYFEVKIAQPDGDAESIAQVACTVAAVVLPPGSTLDPVALARNMNPKLSVRAMTTGEITLSGEQTIDDVACVAGDRVAVNNQEGGIANGIYVVSSGLWRRAEDFASNDQIKPVAYFFVQEGTTYGKKLVYCTTNAPITLGTTPISFAVYGTGGGSSLAVAEDGETVVAAATILNFTGAGVSVTDAGDGQADVDIPGGGGGSGMVPFARAVYVDKDATALSAAGLLAYSTLADAVAAWRDGGAAHTKWGAPSADKPALVIVGAGEWQLTEMVTFDVPYMTVTGATDDPRNHVVYADTNSEATWAEIGNYCVGWGKVTAAHVHFANLQMSNIDSSSGVDYGTYCSIVFRNAPGEIRNCIFEAPSGGGNNRGWIYGSGIVDIVMRNCRGKASSANDGGGNIISTDASDCTSSKWHLENIQVELQSNMNAIGYMSSFDSGADVVIKDFKVSKTGDYAFFTGFFVADSTCTKLEIDGFITEANTNSYLSGHAGPSSSFIINSVFSCSTVFGYEAFPGLIQNCVIRSPTTWNDKPTLQVTNGARIKNTRIISNTTYPCINASGSVNVEISHCTLRRPTGGDPGSSIGSNVTNICYTDTNTEVPSTVTE